MQKESAIFKAQAIDFALKSKEPIEEIAKDLRMDQGTLRVWLRQYEERQRVHRMVAKPQKKLTRKEKPMSGRVFFDHNFKMDCIKKVLDNPDRQQKDIADELGVNAKTLANWLSMYRNDTLEKPRGDYTPKKKTNGARSAPPKTIRGRLELENEMLRQENEMLKKWVEFYREGG